MAAADLPQVERVGDIVHPAFPEETGVFAERLRLFPAGCLVLAEQAGLLGYAVSHPWLFGPPPKLDSRLGALPPHPDTYYLHDIALLPAARGHGFGGDSVERLAQLAIDAGLDTLSLVAVSGSAPFWRRSGFEPVDDPTIRAAMLSYGGAAQFMVRRLTAPSGERPSIS